MKTTRLWLLAALLAGLAWGCKKSAPEAAPQSTDTNAATPAPSQTATRTAAKPEEAQPDRVARIHWLGKKRLAGETNAASLMTVWSLPESARLEAQTLDKLALAIAGVKDTELTKILATGSNGAARIDYSSLVALNPAASKLRPLIEDLLQEEVYFELHKPTDQPAALALAIKLSNARAGVWQTNLAAVFAPQSGQPVTADGKGWEVQTPHGALAYRRSGNWAFVASRVAPSPTPDPGIAALLGSWAARVNSEPDGNPFAASATNFWLLAEADLATLPGLDTQQRSNSHLPKLLVTVTGDGMNVRTRAEAEFPQPLRLELEPWVVPTNRIMEPLIGFSAVRGFRSLLASFGPWNDLKLGIPPNQACFWARGIGVNQHFVAVPSPEATNQVRLLSDLVLRELNPVVAGSTLGAFQKNSDAEGFAWRGIPLFAPKVEVVTDNNRPFILGGFSANRSAGEPMPLALLQQLYSDTNTVVYDWEHTWRCLQGLTPMCQIVRHWLNYARLPVDPEVAWLVAAAPRLGNAVTGIKMPSPTHLTLSRNSTIGFTGVELELLVDWLASPTFPRGIYSMVAPAPPRPPVPEE